MEIVAYAILDTRSTPPRVVRRLRASLPAASVILGKQLAAINRDGEPVCVLAEVFADSLYKIIDAPPGPEIWWNGIVSSFSRRDGYGFVSVPGIGADVFVHASTLTRQALRSINRGDEVEIQYVAVERGYQAVALRLPDGGGDA